MKFLKTYLIELVYMTFLFIVFNYLTKFTVDFLDIFILLATTFFIVSILEFIKYKKWLYLGINIISFIYILASSMHYVVKGQVLYLSQISELDEFLPHKDMLFDYFSFKYLLVLIPLIVTSILLFKVCDNSRLKFSFKKFGLLVLSILVYILCMYFIDKDLYTLKYDGTLYVDRFGNASFFVRQLNPFVPKKTTVVREKTVKNNYEHEYIGLLENKKTVIYITAESLSYDAIDEKLTPNLYKLKTEGITFSNYFTQTVSTFGSEYASLTSIIPPISSSYLGKYTGNFDSLISMFKAQGYCTNSFHANVPDYYNRGNVYYSIFPLDNAYFIGDLGLEWGNDGLDFPRDGDLFDASVKLFDDTCTSNFYYYLTYSGHGSYNKDERDSIKEYFDVVRDLYPDYDDDYTSYLAANINLDVMIEKMLDYYKDNLDDLVIIMVSDHYPYGLNGLGYDKKTSTTFSEKHTDDLYLYNVPFIVYTPTMSLEDVDTYIDNVDILPTISDLFNINYDYSYGASAFDKTFERCVKLYYARMFSVIGENFYYDGKFNKYIGDKEKAKKYSTESKKEVIEINKFYP